MLKKTQSVESWEMPWMGKWKRNRTLVVPQSQSGRNVDETCFLLCFVSVFLLSSSLILIGLSIWSLIKKIPYYSLVDIRTDTSYFTLPAAILGIPTCWVAASIHNKANNSRFTLLLVFLITLSIILLVVGSIVGFTYSTKIDNSTSRVVYNIENALLNQSLQASFLYINASAAYSNPWHKTQSQLKCCGITSYKDWLDNGMQIPSSCCSNTVCSPKTVFQIGCLDALSRDLVWHKNSLTSHAYMMILIQLILIILAVLAYFLNSKK